MSAAVQGLRQDPAGTHRRETSVIACPFCRAASGDVDTRIVAEWPDALAIVPLDPVVVGHAIVIPRGHISDVLEDPIITAAVFARAAQLADQLWLGSDREDDPWPDVQGVNLITSCGEAATQTVRHLHVHLVPRRFGDGLALPWTGQATP